MKKNSVLLAAIFLPLVLLSEIESARVDSEQSKVVFDMDETKFGLDYLNYNEEEHLSQRRRGTGSGPVLEGVGQTAAEEFTARSDSIPLMMKPLMVSMFLLRDILQPGFTVAALPVKVVGESSEYSGKKSGILTNRPTGHPGSQRGSNKEMGTFTPQRFTKEEQRPLGELLWGEHESINDIAKPKPLEGFDADLPEKKRTNHASGGRGVRRVLYPAHPDRP